MKSVLIASRDQDTCQAMFNSLKGDYHLSLLKSAAHPETREADHQLIVLDSDMTEKNGIDLLSRLRSLTSAPILYLAPENTAENAILALEKGAFNYILKTNNYIDLLPCTISLALDQYDELCKLRKANRKLIAHIKSTELQKKNNPYDKPPEADKDAFDPEKEAERITLIQMITKRLKKGEVNLPSVPDLIIKVNKLVECHASIAQLAAVISNDAAIATSLIRISNSSRYRGVSENRNLDQAINRLGIEQSMVYVQMISNRSLFTTKDELLAPIFKNLWTHSMACAHTSQIISEKLSVGNCFDIFMMGLLHDVGALFLIQVIAEVRSTGEDLNPTQEDLYELLHDYHSSFGKSLLQRWHFPDEYIEVAANHEHPEKCASITDRLLVINLADRIINSLGYTLNPADEEPVRLKKGDITLGATAELIEEIRQQSRELIENFSSDTSL